MFFRECKVCGYPMDPGEGQNGVCDECLAAKERRQSRKEKVARMIRCTDYKQMEVEEFLR